LPRPHPAQEQILRTAKRFNVLDCGRRWGKTVIGIILVAHALLRGESVGWFAPSYKILADAYRIIQTVLQPIVLSSNRSENIITTITGGKLEFWTLSDINAGRSRKYHLVIIDEGALEPNLLAVWNASIRPTLTDYRGSAWFMSTPKGHNGFYHLYNKGLSDPEWQCWTYPTGTNPYIDPKEIEAAKNDLPEQVFQQEFMAAFLEDGGGVFRKVAQAATLQPIDGPVPGHQYVFGVDWGKFKDFTAIAVWDVGLKHLVKMDRFNHIDYSFQRQRLGVLYDKFMPIVMIPESNSIGEPNIEELRDSGYPVQGFLSTNASKKKAVEALSLGFEQEVIKVVNDPILIAELQSFTVERLPGGGLRYAAPEGSHDDCVIAAMIGYLEGVSQYISPAEMLAVW